MKIETLKQSHLKRNIIIGVGVVLIISAVVLNFTKAKYRVTESIPLVNGTINYTLPDLNIVGLYIDGVEASELDSSKSYTLDTTQSTCTYKDGTEITDLSISYDSDTSKLTITPFTTKGTKCTLYFEEKVSANEYILANTELGTGTPNFANTSCSAGSNINSSGTSYNNGNCGEETVGIYEETTSKGTTYYWRGDVEDNYLVFANKYWRIIRINEDGTIRIIYSGEKSTVDSAGASTVLANGYNDGSTQYTQIGTSAFNEDYNASYYVGYTYTENAQRPSSQNGGTASTIKGVLDTWYSNNLSSYDSKIASGGSAGFCNDREMASGYTWSATPSSSIYYASYERIYTNYQPSYECSQTNDIYTTKIGLITADEVAYAGGKGGYANYGYYLYTGNNYRTMSPCHFNGSHASVVGVYSTGSIIAWNVQGTIGVRPVINLRADISISGTGLSSDPYVVS